MKIQILAPCPEWLCIFVMHSYLAEFFNKVHDIRRTFFINLFFINLFKFE